MRCSAPKIIVTSCCLIAMMECRLAQSNDRRSTVVFVTSGVVQASAEMPATVAFEQPARQEPPALVEPLRVAELKPVAEPEPEPVAQPAATTPAPSSPETGAQQAFAQPAAPPAMSPPKHAVRFFIGQSEREMLNQMPQRMTIYAGAPQRARQGKPFEVVEQNPTISPYLNLDRDADEAEGVPNYFTYVRPQMEQIQANRMQQRELIRLRAQVQGMSSPAAGGRFRSGRMPSTGTQARFMDTAQFYSGHR